MAEICISIAAKVAEYLVKPAISQGKYLFCVNKVIKDLENAKEELTLERDSLQGRVEQAKNRTEVIEKRVEEWLDDVKKLLEEVDDLRQKVSPNNNCFQGRCPTWGRYRLCKQMVKKIEAMGKRKGKSKDMEPISQPPRLPGIQFRSSENFAYFKSTEVAGKQLWEALRDDSIYMIGLYGMGGSGKTTLVTEVGKAAEDKDLFDRVILVTVSQTPNIRNLQGKIADLLNLELKEESEEGRAQRLWLRLKEEKRILIIADDIWGKFNLEDIGIRLDDDYKGRGKVLVTTRRRDVCDSMKCQKRIKLDHLDEDDAWTLFKKHAEIDDAFSRSKNDVPRDLCKECKGLPIAIVAVGSSLKEKSDDEWKWALDSLRHSESIDDHVEPAFRCLKLSYDYLKNEDVKLLFLMCSMFPEDYEIFIEDLIRYAIGLRSDRRPAFDSERSRIRAGINKLVDSCLLMHSGHSAHHVKMHDVVRDVALTIAKRSDAHKILVNLDKPLGTLAEDDGIKEYFAISSWCKEIDPITHPLDAPNLKILSLTGSSGLSFASFEGIKGLNVLAVINELFMGQSVSLLQSTPPLTNLRTLRLNGCRLGDMSFLGRLTGLEILDLRGCISVELPNEVGNLKRLKLLDLSFCHGLKNRNYEAIGKCSQLEELYVSGSPDCRSQSVVDIVTLPKLQRFVIQIGCFKRYDYAGSMRVLNLLYFNISSLGASKQNLLQKADHVRLERLRGGCKNIIPDMVGVVGAMNDLTNLGLRDCAEIECLIDTTYHVDSLQVDAFIALIPRLVNLELSGLDNLKEVCRDPHLQVLGFFEKLEELYIAACQKLHSIFAGECNLRNLKILKIGNYGSKIRKNWEFTNCTAAEVLFSMSVAQSLQQLEELTVEGCKKLKHIIASGGEHGSNTREDIVSAPRNSRLVMPNLKKLSIHFCTKLECIFPISCVEGLAQLQEIEISEASELKYVFGGDDDHSSLQNEIQIRLPLLKVFKLNDLQKIMGICPKNYHFRYPSMRELSIINCPKFTTSIAEMDGLALGQQDRNMSVAADEGQQLQLTSSFEHLTLADLPELIFMSPTPDQKLSLQYLQHLEVYRCEKLKCIFPIVVHKSLSQLTSLKVYGCEELEEIIAENEELENPSVAELCFPKLTALEIGKCNKLKSLFSVAMVRMLPKLSILSISNASQLEVVFSSEDSTVNERKIVLPNLTDVTLNDLPSFVDICHGFKLQAMKLQILSLGGCPKYSPNLTAIEATLVSRQPERVAVDEGQQMPVPSNLERLELKGLPELIFIWPTPPRMLSLQYLKDLKVDGCRKLKSVFPMVVHKSLSKLESLRIYNCEGLEEIIAENEELENLSDSELCFPELRILKVKNCNELKSLFSIAMVRMLPQLSILHISGATQLEEVFRHGCEDGSVSEMEIVLPNLTDVKLYDLPSFVDFCPGLKLQAMNSPISRQPERVAVDEGQQMLVTSNLKRLQLEGFPELIFIWPTPRRMLSHQYLQHLKVDRCRKLKSVFPMVVHKSLSKLKSLRIYDCEGLEEIIAENEEPENLSDSALCFSKLRILKVKNCNQLKSLFSIAVARMLPRLSILHISRATQLEEVFRHGCEDSNVNEMEIVLPYLKLVKLNELPSFVDFCQGFKLRAVNLQLLHIDECPKTAPILRAAQVPQQQEMLSEYEGPDSDSLAYDSEHC